MNWIKLKELYPKVHDELKELEKEHIHYSSRNLIEIYHKRKNIPMLFPFTVSLNKIELSL